MTEGSSLRSRIARPDGTAAWLLPVALAIEVLFAARSTHVPSGGIVYYPLAWSAITVIALLACSLAAARLRPDRPRLGPVEVMVVLALTAMVLTDIEMAWQPLRDLGIYLRAGQHFLDGSAVYAQTPLASQPLDRTWYPFLYPPFTLPFFGLLSLLPVPVSHGLWVAGSLTLGLLALRLIGLPWRWVIPVIVWPPFFEGLWVGNVAVPALFLFAIGPWLGAGLVLGAVFKSYTAVATLWLARERSWLQLAAGLAIVVALIAATLPLTGTQLWSDWLDGLRVYQSSQRLLPSLYGLGLPRFVPFPVYAAAALLAIAGAWLVRGRDSLARFGTATVVAAPSLFGHGMLMAVPSILSLRTAWAWLAIGLLSTPDGALWWLAIGVVTASWLVAEMRREEGVEDSAEPWHPLGSGRLWPDRSLRRLWPERRPQIGLGNRQVQHRGLGEGVSAAAERPADGLDPDRPRA
jgi:hypothetical protein